MIAWLMYIALAFAGETVWATEDVQSQRFPDDTVEGPFLSAGDELELIVREGGKVRVKKGNEFGWIPASAITTTAPEAEEPE